MNPHKKVLILTGDAFEGLQGDPVVEAFAEETQGLLQEVFKVENVKHLDSVMKYRKKEAPFSPFKIEDESQLDRAGALHILVQECFDAGYQPVSAPIEDFFKNNAFDVNDHWVPRLEEIGAIALSSTHILRLTTLMKLLKALKSLEKIVIVGGALVRLLDKTEHQKLPFDYCSASEAEGNLSAILKQIRMKDPEQLEMIPGLYWKENERLYESKTPIFLIDFDSWRCYPTPEFLKKRSGIHQYESVRGCPFRCEFCNYPYLAGNANFRTKSAESIFEEWSTLERLGTRHIELIDSLVTFPKKRIKKLCRLLIDSGLAKKLTWSCCARSPELTDPDFVKLLKAAGCRYVFIGIESGAQIILKNMNKGTTVKQNALAIKNCNEIGLYSSAGILVGFPGETSETIKMTTDFLKQQSCPSVHVFTWVPDFNPTSLVPIMQPDRLKKFSITGGGPDVIKYEVSVWGKQLSFGLRTEWQHETMNQEEALHHACSISDHIFSNEIDVQDFSFSPYRCLLQHPTKLSAIMDYSEHVNFEAGWKHIYKMYLNKTPASTIREYIPNWLESSGFSWEETPEMAIN